MANINIFLHINLQLILWVSLGNMVICISAKKRLCSRLWLSIYFKWLGIFRNNFSYSNLELLRFWKLNVQEVKKWEGREDGVNWRGVDSNTRCDKTRQNSFFFFLMKRKESWKEKKLCKKNRRREGEGEKCLTLFKGTINSLSALVFVISSMPSWYRFVIILHSEHPQLGIKFEVTNVSFISITFLWENTVFNDFPFREYSFQWLSCERIQFLMTFLWENTVFNYFPLREYSFQWLSCERIQFSMTFLRANTVFNDFPVREYSSQWLSLERIQFSMTFLWESTVFNDFPVRENSFLNVMIGRNTQ